MGAVTWTAYGTETEALTTELNSLADGGESALGTEIDNTTDRDMFMDLHITLASLNPTTGAHLIVRVYTAVDGSAYEDAASAIPYRVSIDTGSAAKEAAIRGIALGPGKYKLTVQNKCNVSFGATGNTVEYRKYTPTVA